MKTSRKMMLLLKKTEERKKEKEDTEKGVKMSLRKRKKPQDRLWKNLWPRKKAQQLLRKLKLGNLKK